jgi:hypothetical protein
MQKLNFPVFSFKYKNTENKPYIFDIIRKRYYLLTPEEWVRQHMIHYLIYHKNISPQLISVEKQLDINGLKRRFDLVVFNKKMQAYILVECKAPHIKIDQKTFDQANQYNWLLKAPYLILTNGMKHYICEINFDKNNYRFLTDIPKPEL